MFGTGWQSSDLYPRPGQERHEKAFSYEGITNVPNEKLLEADDSDDQIFQPDNAFTYGEDVDASEDMQEQKEDAATEASASNQSSLPLAEYRPNKYHGAASTWRSWTQKERKIAKSLQEIRARDLSAHLFNAFALKRRAQEMKHRVMEGEEHQNFPSRMNATSSPFIPQKQWTSWPMPASEVPRQDETISKDQDDIWTLKMPTDPRPSADLEDCLVAVMMRAAKERFYERKWMPDRQGDTSQGVDTADGTGIEDDWPISIDLYHSRELRPVVQADDEKSRQQLRPQVRHIMTQFDSLLMGLHHLRKASVAPEYSSDTDTDTDVESTVLPLSLPRKRRRVDPSLCSQKRGRKRTRATPQRTRASSTMEIGDSSEAPLDLQTSAESLSTSPHQSRPRGQSVKRSQNFSRPSPTVARLGLRDWNDVLGIASITSWPQPVVMRAAKRCADLFGGDMMFRTMLSGKVEPIKTEDGENTWSYVEDDEGGHAITPSLPTTISADVATTGPSEAFPAVPGKGKGDHRKQDLICPVEQCRRHTKGFSRTWNLNLHLKRVHQDYYRGLTSKPPIEGAS
jgi:RNA polymerase I specific transcription initiation factor RRN9